MRDFAKDETLMFSPVPAEDGAIRCVYAYPNDYTVGITSLGFQLVWAFMSKRTDVDVRRLFMDANEPLPQARRGRASPHALSTHLRAQLSARGEASAPHIPPAALSPQSPALVGFSLSWELDYANVLTLLERLSVPLLAEERTDDDPIVFGGGGVLTVRSPPPSLPPARRRSFSHRLCARL